MTAPQTPQGRSSWLSVPAVSAYATMIAALTGVIVALFTVGPCARGETDPGGIDDPQVQSSTQTPPPTTVLDSNGIATTQRSGETPVGPVGGGDGSAADLTGRWYVKYESTESDYWIFTATGENRYGFEKFDFPSGERVGDGEATVEVNAAGEIIVFFNGEGTSGAFEGEITFDEDGDVMDRTTDQSRASEFGSPGLLYRANRLWSPCEGADGTDEVPDLDLAGRWSTTYDDEPSSFWAFSRAEDNASCYSFTKHDAAGAELGYGEAIVEVNAAGEIIVFFNGEGTSGAFEGEITFDEDGDVMDRTTDQSRASEFGSPSTLFRE